MLRAALTLCAVLLAAAFLASSPAAHGSQTRSASEPIAQSALGGRPLADALQLLRARGLNIVFTTNVVRPDMTVENEPSGDPADLVALLAEILEEHDLEARAAPNQTLVIVPRGTPRVEAAAASDGSIVGFVRSRRDSSPIEGVIVRVLWTDIEVRSGPNGSFAIAGLEDGSVPLEVRRRGFVVERIEGVPVAAGEVTELPILLNPAPVTEEELIVTPSRVSLLRQEPAAPLSLSRKDILALPQLGDDFFRALSLLPGISANDVSAQFHVRGGRRDETRIVLDGQELYDTFHLKEFDSALSIIAPTTLESVDLSTGSFSAEHGDRMSGVLDMTTLTPTGPPRGRVGLGVLGGELGGAGSFNDQKGSWIGQARRGANDFAGKLIGPERPVYWDAFGKLDYQIRPGNSVRANVLHSDDEFNFTEITVDGEKRINTDYRSSYLWVTDQAILEPNLYLETALSRSRIDRDRNGLELDEEVQWTVFDRRDLEVLSLRQNWNFQAGNNHYMKWGFELRDFDVQFDYRSEYDFESPIALLRSNGPEGSILFQKRFEESHDSLYFSDRIDLGKAATLELGLRFDSHSQTDESHLTPRLNLAHSFGRGSIVRAAWGRFYQSQRPYELQVEDGDTLFRPVERSEHRLLGLEHLFESTPRANLVLRVELYQREIQNPQPRWENIYEPLNEFQEAEPDRRRITPDRSFSKGIELFLRGRAGRKTDWFVNYTLASTEDEVEGARQRRRFDQTHGLNLDFDVQLTEDWTFNLAWRYHTGWPTTPLSVVEVPSVDPEPGEDPGEDDSETMFVPVLGEPFGSRLSDYHRLDLRVSRRWNLRSGRLTLFADIQNVYNRKNAAGFDYEIDEDDGTLIPNPETWQGFFPSLGLRWEF
ncbi:MAG: TonB-dependent receptor domain-containing protein [Thermoanaerobaculia bacterium]